MHIVFILTAKLKVFMRYWSSTLDDSLEAYHIQDTNIYCQLKEGNMNEEEENIARIKASEKVHPIADILSYHAK